MDPKRFETLAAAYVEGTIDEEASAELLSIVEADADAKRELARQLRTDRLLRASRSQDLEPVIRALASRRVGFTTRVVAKIRRRPAPASRWPFFAAVSAAAVLICIAAVFARRPAPPAAAPIAVQPVPTPERPEPRPEPRPELPRPPAPAAPEPLTIPERAPAPAVPPAETPAPPPAPAPAKTPDVPPTVAEAAVAVFEGVRDLRAGERVAGPGIVRWPDGSRVELAAGADFGELRPNGGRLAQGVLHAQVAKQLRGFSVATPHGEAVVLGTRFTLKVDAAATALEVEEGKVRLKRSDGMGVDVGPGLAAVAAKGVALAARPILRTMSFQDGVAPEAAYAGTRDVTLAQLSPTENRGGEEQLALWRGVEGVETALLRWDVSAIPAGSRVLSAEITLWVTGAVGTPGWRLHDVLRAWEEREATWKSPWQIPGAAGDADRGRAVGLLSPSAPGFATVPLPEALVQRWVAGGNAGVVFVPLAQTARWGIESREAPRPDRRPRLTVTFAPAR